MSDIAIKRLQQGIFESLASQNRAAGSGGGSGMQFMASLGIGNQSGTQNFSSQTYATVTGTAVTFVISRVTNLRLDFIWTGKVTAGANNGQVRINAGSLGTTGDAYIGVPNYITSSAWLFVPAVQPGTYTAQIEARSDVAGTTLQLIQSALQVLQLGF